MVGEAQVWEALEEIPDPEIPVVSLVELGVVRDVAVEGDQVTIEFTPTFLGCPALEVMRDRMADAVPLDPLLRCLPAAVRAVQDHLSRHGLYTQMFAVCQGFRPCLDQDGVAAVIKSEGNDSQGG